MSDVCGKYVLSIEEYKKNQDKKLEEILSEIKDIKINIARSAESAIHNEYAIKAIHKRVDELEEDVKKCKENIEKINEKLRGNVTWPGVVVLICKAGAFFGGLGMILAALNKVFLK